MDSHAIGINHKKRHLSPRTCIIFFVVLTVGILGSVTLITNRSRVEKMTMEQLIYDKSIKINEVLSKLLYKTQTLSYLVRQDDGIIMDFSRISAMIVDDPAIKNILIAPSGVVSEVYPLEGNESVVGLDFFAEGAGNKEAVIAVETGQLIMGGPFDAVQGGQILVGRLPLYTDAPDGSKDFWGLISVTLKFPQALEGAGLNELSALGFAYELWRVNPDTGEKQIISDSGHRFDKNINYVEKQITIANAEWYFRILPVKKWYAFPEAWISIVAGLLISLLVAVVTQNNHELTKIKTELEELSRTDALTGIYNRRFFMESAAVQMNRICRAGSNAYLIMFDIDYFKLINDKHGHQVGDMVLKEVCERIAKKLRPYDLFARYGGEEFIVLAADLDHQSVKYLVERMRTSVVKKPIDAYGVRVPVTISFGIAPVAPQNNLDVSIRLADEALYIAKEKGRDRIEFHMIETDNQFIN